MSATERRGWNASFVTALKPWRSILPVLAGTVLLLGTANATLLPRLGAWLAETEAFGLVAGASIGGLLAGNPVTSYVIAEDLLGAGVATSTVSAFLIAWVTVGIVQLPAEIEVLGLRFALLRNASALILAILTGLVLGVLL